MLSVLTAIILSGHAGAAAEQSSPAPFAPGEKLHYEVYWTRIKAAEATLEILPMTAIDGRGAWHFGMTVATTSLVSHIYPVISRIEARAEADMSRSLQYSERKRTRSDTKEVSIIFDWETATAQYIRDDREPQSLDLQPGAFDPLSIFYFFRMQELHGDLELSRPVTDGKRCLEGIAHVRSRQTVRVGDREWDTWLVEPDLRQIEGVFEKNPRARLRIWVTVDEHRIPVMVKSRIAVGSFTAKLVNIEQPK